VEAEPKPSDTPEGEILPEDPELYWLHHTYRGEGERQLTVRAVIAGMLLGGVMSLSNLYISLVTGWSFGVTITAGILAFVIFKLLTRIGLVKTEFGMLENNAMQSVASAAGYMTGGGTVAAIPGLMLLTHSTVPSHQIFLWITGIAFLGVFMAIPMKRQMINHEQLRFPSGIAAAETLRSLHPVHDGTEKEGPSEGELQAKALLWSGIVGAVSTWLREAKATWWPKFLHIPEKIVLPFTFKGAPLLKWTIAFDTSLLLFAAGGIMGFRAAWSMMLGAAINYFYLAPKGVSLGQIPLEKLGQGSIVKFTVWFGASLMLTSGLLAFAFSWRQIARALAGVKTLFGGKADEDDPLAAVEVPSSWFVIGTLAVAPVVILCGSVFFGMKWWLTALCIVLSFFLAIVACRATGETDTTPGSALAKITQIGAGVAAPGSVTTNLMAANVSAGIALHSADLLTDLKSGYLLGAKPRQQFYAQFFGVIAGSAFVVPALRLLVPDWTVLGTRFPAPGALSWSAVAKVLAGGVRELSGPARWLIVIGGITGIVLVLVERAFPKKKEWIPSAIGLGLAFTLPFWNCISMFFGACVALAIERRNKAFAERWVVPVSSGIIAGESLIGIVIAGLVAAKIFQQ